MPEPTDAAPAQYVDRPEGRIAFEVAGDGPLVVLVPGMGDLRSGYRFLAPALRALGYRVASTDLRGHGDSDAAFTSFGDVETAGDISALIDELGGPAIVVGNSLAAGAAVILAAQHPRQVSALVLLGPFVRNPKVSPLMALAFRAATARPWVAMTWKQYLPTLYAGRRPGDFDEYRTSVIAALRRPGYAAAFSRTIRQTDHAPAEAQLHAVDVPVLVVMGERDPDFADPADEARWIGEALRADVVMVPEAGHYPQSQQPELTTAAVEAFLSRLAHA